MRLEEVEDGDGETEDEDEYGSIFSQIKLDVTKISTEGGSEVFEEDEYEEQLCIEVFVSSDEEDDGDSE